MKSRNAKLGLFMIPYGKSDDSSAEALQNDGKIQLAVFANKEHITGTRDDLAALLSMQLQAGKQIPKLYMTCGTEDFIFSTNTAFYNKAEKLPVSLKFEKHPGVHNWDFWDAHIRDVINWLPI